VILIGNLTRDPELRYTPAGTGVCTFGLATNRSWTTQTGETKEETEFHKIVAWNKLGELCSQLLTKGRKVYVEGRLSTHAWTGQDGTQRSSTEVVIEDMIILDSRKPVIREEGNSAGQPSVNVVSEKTAATVVTNQPAVASSQSLSDDDAKKTTKKTTKAKEEKSEDKKEEIKEEKISEDITPDDIPF
jgi:single-strand DNA-binding protein